MTRTLKVIGILAVLSVLAFFGARQYLRNAAEIARKAESTAAAAEAPKQPSALPELTDPPASSPPPASAVLERPEEVVDVSGGDWDWVRLSFSKLGCCDGRKPETAAPGVRLLCLDRATAAGTYLDFIASHGLAAATAADLAEFSKREQRVVDGRYIYAFGTAWRTPSGGIAYPLARESIAESGKAYRTLSVAEFRGDDVSVDIVTRMRMNAIDCALVIGHK